MCCKAHGNFFDERINGDVPSNDFRLLLAIKMLAWIAWVLKRMSVSTQSKISRISHLPAAIKWLVFPIQAESCLEKTQILSIFYERKTLTLKILQPISDVYSRPSLKLKRVQWKWSKKKKFHIRLWHSRFNHLLVLRSTSMSFVSNVFAFRNLYTSQCTQTEKR